MDTLENSHVQSLAEPEVVPVGDSAVLLVPSTSFDGAIQGRLQALAALPKGSTGSGPFSELVLGVNNLLGAYDPLVTSIEDAVAAMKLLWKQRLPQLLSHTVVEIPVTYGGPAGEDLPDLAAAAGLSIRDYVERHSQTRYTVACIGAYPGFAFMTGLPKELAAPRRPTPRLSLAKGSVIVGGVQAGVMSCTAPSGWHVLGTTDVDMFDVHRDPPCLVHPGDAVRFTVKEIQGA